MHMRTSTPVHTLALVYIYTHIHAYIYTHSMFNQTLVLNPLKEYIENSSSILCEDGLLHLLYINLIHKPHSIFYHIMF